MTASPTLIPSLWAALDRFSAISRVAVTADERQKPAGVGEGSAQSMNLRIRDFNDYFAMRELGGTDVGDHVAKPVDVDDSACHCISTLLNGEEV